MARKNVVSSYKMISAGDMSASSITSTTTNVLQMDKASIHLSWSGTAPVGVVTVQSRNGSTDGWQNLDFGTAINISGNSGDHLLVLNELPFTDLQVIYTKTSGTGTLNATITMKQVGG